MRLIDCEQAKRATYEEVFWTESEQAVVRNFLAKLPKVDAVEVVHGRWEDGRCSNCQEEALSTSWDEPIYDYDWEENLRYAYTETHKEYHLTDYCPYCGAKMDGDGNG